MSMEFNLRSGETYCLAQMLRDKRQLVVPDMQRDYCWAHTQSEIDGNSLVTNFVRDLKLQVQSNEPVQMGLLYAYESPKHHIQLCDGQQRLTTLYLLFGEIFRKLIEGDRKRRVKDVLQVVGVNGQPQPRLQYAIRETTLSFLDDLVKEYIFNGSCNAEEITEQDWFFSEYNLDPSVLNMLEAIKLIKNELSGLDQFEELTDLLLDRIEFLYFDMMNRTYGEEQFVVINTTGKPLTTSENIKPKLLGELDDNIKRKEFGGKTALRYCADLWESWEDFFWQNNDDKGQVADDDLNEFFRWIYIVEKISRSDNEGAQATLQSAKHAILNLRHDESPQSCVALIDLIQEYFLAIKKISIDEEIKRWLFKGESLSQVNLFVLLPLLGYIRNHKYEISNRYYLRFKRYLQSKSKQGAVTKSIGDAVVAAVRLPIILHGYNEGDIAFITSVNEKISETIFNECDRYKFNLIKAAEDREKVEESFWKAENFEISQGNIEYEFQILGVEFSEDTSNFSLEQFDKLTAILKLTLEKPTDFTRRVLLTFGHYYVWHGRTTKLIAHRYSLGLKTEFFRKLLQLDDPKHETQKTCLIEFVKEILKLNSIDEDSYMKWGDKRIENFSLSKQDLWEEIRFKLVKNEKLFGDMREKLFCITDDETQGFALTQRNVTGTNTYQEIHSVSKSK